MRVKPEAAGCAQRRPAAQRAAGISARSARQRRRTMRPRNPEGMDLLPGLRGPRAARWHQTLAPDRLGREDHAARRPWAKRAVEKEERVEDRKGLLSRCRRRGSAAGRPARDTESARPPRAGAPQAPSASCDRPFTRAPSSAQGRCYPPWQHGEEGEAPPAVTSWLASPPLSSPPRPASRRISLWSLQRRHTPRRCRTASCACTSKG